MKKMFILCTSSLLLQNINCASDEKKTLLPAEISTHVSYAYMDYMNTLFFNLQKPGHRAGVFFARDVRY